MIEKFNIKKLTRQLKKINKENNKPCDAGIQLITNNMMVYNELVDNINYKETKTLYLIYQMSATVFNQLKEFQIFPDKKKADNDDQDDKLTLIKKKFETR